MILNGQIKNPIVPIYFTNRALCFLKLKQWDKACTDCRRALEMDFSFIKGCFFLGIALIEIGSYDEAIKQLQRGNRLISEFLDRKIFKYSVDVVYCQLII